jgi:hypothetical protein
MPRFDGTGPFGMGPMTGRGFGPCGFGFGWRKKFGGRSWPQTKNQTTATLEEYKKALEEELDDVTQELKGLNNSA